MTVHELQFWPRARLVSILGEDLISDQAVGLIELVKNAFVRIAGVGRFIEGVLQKTVTVGCVVQGFDASGALESTHGCTVFAVLPR
jgi:hypothetical protein